MTNDVTVLTTWLSLITSEYQWRHNAQLLLSSFDHIITNIEKIERCKPIISCVYEMTITHCDMLIIIDNTKDKSYLVMLILILILILHFSPLLPKMRSLYSTHHALVIIRPSINRLQTRTCVAANTMGLAQQARPHLQFCNDFVCACRSRKVAHHLLTQWKGVVRSQHHPVVQSILVTNTTINHN
jgi:hypothetical protein